MTASQKSSENNTRNGSTRTATKSAASAASDTTEKATGALTALPAPIAEKAYAATRAVGGTVGPGGRLWTVLGARKAVTSGASVASAAALTGAYLLGRRSERRRLGPLSRLIAGRL
ncbi:hypothetical protein [Streptomyces uncialis]|uniref:Uncharacterized protein n=1 Tax=Streptomyces uncialis TaxID=1048205 RepID=A0A1Q4V755_9ACTN|nr:hypothetical protein [Streptomyces uncialis]MCX4659293.1 hypothetical protein [Streptomyces uncialis]OKH93570.1 hypothetical protein AB852_19150 [Streptomyces uncialis]WTE13927.1 hypothetical protein OG924_29075 [Streptomyces uncialis]